LKEENVKNRSLQFSHLSHLAVLFSPGLCLCLLVTPVLSQALKLGYVDSQVIIQQFPEAQEAQQKIESSLKQWQAEIDTMAKVYQTRLEEYDKKKAMLNEQAKLAEEQKLLEQQQKILDYRNRKLGQGGELQQLQDKTMTPVRDKIIKAIGAVAKEEGMSFVFDKGAEVPVLLFGEARFDITFKVLDRLKRGR
jgi:outer membrane protein